MTRPGIDAQTIVAAPGEAAAGLSRGGNGAARYIGVILTVLIGGSASIGAFLAVAHSDAVVAESSFVDRAKSYERALNLHLSNAAGVLYTLKAYFETTTAPVTAADYEAFSASLRARLVGLRDTGWSPRVARNERATFERSVQAAGFPGFQITERNAEGMLVRAQERDDYFPILYSDPSAPNKIVQGYYVGSERLRRQAIQTALSTGKPTATPPITLVNQNRQQEGFISFLPVYNSDRPGNQSDSALKGVIFDVFETGQMIEDVLASRMHLADVSIYFANPNRPVGARLIYWHAPRAGAMEQAIPTEASLLAAGRCPLDRLITDRRPALGCHLRTKRKASGRPLDPRRNDGAWYRYRHDDDECHLSAVGYPPNDPARGSDCAIAPDQR
jgi:diguanylate cyclase